MLDLARRKSLGPNRVKTWVGRFSNNMFCWGLVKSPFCNFEPEPQTAERLTYHSPIQHPQGGNVDITAPDETTVQ